MWAGLVPDAGEARQEKGKVVSATDEVIRVFPRRTNQTPIDERAFVGWPTLFVPSASRVEISVAFTWDLPLADRLAVAWAKVAPVRIGGPALGEPAGEFVPGRYLRPGNVITSRGCWNRCWFCQVWRAEKGLLKELPIRDGWNLQDDNLLACSESHIAAVFQMLKRQKHRIHFTGGLEAARLKDWHVDALRNIRPKQVFFAYDSPDDLEPLRDAGQRLLAAGFTRTKKQLRAFVLIGYPDDTMHAAEGRLYETMKAGFLPMAMLWRDTDGKILSVQTHQWRSIQRYWARPAITYKVYREMT